MSLFPKVQYKNKPYFDKKNNISNWKVAGFVGQILYIYLERQPDAFVSRWEGWCK